MVWCLAGLDFGISTPVLRLAFAGVRPAGLRMIFGEQSDRIFRDTVRPIDERPLRSHQPMITAPADVSAVATPAMPFDADDSYEHRLKPLTIGNVEIGFPIVQAALSGYSDLPMRVIARSFGASYTICEVMLDEFLLNLGNRRRTKHFLDIHPDEPPVGGQLMGAEPEQFSAGAAKLSDAGYDIIDVNFGCPVKKVLGRCRGGFHLSQPNVAIEILRRTRDAVPSDKPVTVKMRRGIDDSDQSRDQFFEILDGALDAGLDAATVHGRTVVQRYVGPSRWEFLSDVKRHVGDAMKILGSGDLFTAPDALAMIEQTGIDGVTIARGAIGNPWIFRDARALAAGRTAPLPPTLEEQAAVMRRHYELMTRTYGDDRAGKLMRKFAIKYSCHHPEQETVRSRFVKMRDAHDLEETLKAFYSRAGSFK